jgi:hypothetical protein
MRRNEWSSSSECATWASGALTQRCAGDNEKSREEREHGGFG